MEPIHYILIAIALVLLGLALWWVISKREPAEKAGVAERARPGLGKSTGILGTSLRRVWGSGVEDHTWAALEEALIAADVGIGGTEAVVKEVRRRNPSDREEAEAAVAEELIAQFRHRERALELTGTPSVVLVVGVNGSGKTTTIAKLASRLKAEGRTVILGAADTFRAAAAEQLTTWGQRLGVRVVRGNEGADPASVAHDTLSAAGADMADVAIIDTAGRLHGKKNLMAELGKIYRVSGGEDGKVSEVLLVLDATSGQNGLAQVREFAEAVPVTGIVLTKLDGTARGGIVVAVEKELGVPVKFIGLGEGMNDLEPFDPQSFVERLMETV